MSFKSNLVSFAFILSAWLVISGFINGSVLTSSYINTKELWRPYGQMLSPLFFLSTAISTVVFILMYGNFVVQKSLESAVRFGLFYGIAIGSVLSLNSFSSMPITPLVAIMWFVEPIMEGLIGGMIVGHTSTAKGLK